MGGVKEDSHSGGGGRRRLKLLKKGKEDWNGREKGASGWEYKEECEGDGRGKMEGIIKSEGGRRVGFSIIKKTIKNEKKNMRKR